MPCAQSAAEGEEDDADDKGKGKAPADEEDEEEEELGEEMYEEDVAAGAGWLCVAILFRF